MSEDLMIHLMTGAAKIGIDPRDISDVFSKGIERGTDSVNARHQREVVQAKQTRVPRYSRDDHYDPERAAKDEAELRALAEAFGFVYGENYDRNFVMVTLPEGWTLKASDHAMWSYFYDEKGRTRGSMFYKGGFGMCETFMSFYGRYVIDEIKPKNWYELSRPPVLYEEVEVLRPVYDDADRSNERRVVDKRGRMTIMNEFGDVYDSYYDGYGRPSRPQKPRMEKVKEQRRLPDDQQTKPQSYETYYAYIDRATGEELWRGKSFMVPYEGEQHSDPVEAACRSHYQVEKLRKRAANVGLDLFNAMHGANEGAREWLIERPVPLLQANGNVRPLPLSRLEKDYSDNAVKIEAVELWARCIGAIIYWTRDSYYGGYYVWFTENWMKVAFEQKFGFRTEFRVPEHD